MCCAIFSICIAWTFVKKKKKGGLISRIGPSSLISFCVSFSTFLSEEHEAFYDCKY